MQKTILSTIILSVIATAYADNENTDSTTDTKNTNTALNTITVTTTPHDEMNAPASVTVITSEELTSGNVNSISDVLRRTVGVQTTPQMGRSEYQIRGMAGKHTLILVDGKRVSSKNALWRGSNFDNMPVAISKIERVEVIRGPLSTLYGSDAMGGVVNIITKEHSKEISGSVEIGGSKSSDLHGGNSKHIKAYLDLPVSDTFSLSLSASAYDISKWDDGTSGKQAITEPKNKKSFGLSADWQFTNNQELSFDFDFENDLREKSIYRVVKRGPRSIQLLREQEAERARIGVTHKGQWSWGNSTAFINYEKTSIDDFNTAYQLISSPAQRNINEKNIHFKSYVNIDAFDKQIITLGAEYLTTKVSDPISYKKSGTGSSNNIAVFAQDEIALTDSFSLTVGGRYDNHDKFGGHFSPKLYGVFQATDNLSIKGGIARAFKAPGTYQINDNYSMVSCGGRCVLTGESELRPETSTTTELGVAASYDSWNASATFFHTKAKDLIEAPVIRVPGGIKRKWTNISQVRLSGLELDASIDITDSINISGNYTYLSSKDDEGNSLPNRNKHQLFAKLNYDINDHVSVFTSVERESGRSVILSKKSHSMKDFPSIAKINLGSHIRYQGIDFNVGIDNIRNIKVHEMTTPSVLSAPGRTYYANMKYNF